MHFLLLVSYLACSSIIILSELTSLILKLIYFLKLNSFKNFKRILFSNEKVYAIINFSDLFKNYKK